MNYRFRQYALPLTLVLGCGSATAVDLLGDTLSFRRAYPNTGAQYGQDIPDTTVAVGTGDQVVWRFNALGNAITINPEPDRIIFSFPPDALFIGTTSVFDGFVVFGFDADIASISLIDNMTTMSVSLGNGLRTFTVNLSGQSLPNTSLAVAVSLVPEPNIAFLMLVGIVAIGATARRAASRVTTARS